MTEPHSENFCGGNYQDWLEVNLLSECNAKCKWCIEKVGYHPSHKASWEEIAEAAIGTNRKNIILLGGEPLLYNDLSNLIKRLIDNNKNVWITTNGSRLTKKFVQKNLQGISGINISIHHYDMMKNFEITKIIVNKINLQEAINQIHEYNGKVRFNCNLINHYIDTKNELLSYINFVKSLTVDSVRFAELKIDENNFVDLAKILDYQYGLNDDPFVLGCCKEAVIDGISINFRQMCGLQTSCRKKPINPKQYKKEVLYYDGKIYNGWQSSLFPLSEITINQIIDDLSNGKISKDEAKRLFAST